MNADREEQEDELLALHSIFGSDEFVRNESTFTGEIRVSVDLAADFTVVLTEGKMSREYEISFLPPLLLNFELPDNYPSSSPPSFALTCSWLTNTQLSALTAQLTDLYQATEGAVVLFSWVQFLREDALTFLDIHNVLELPSVEQSTPYDGQDTPNAAHSELNNQHNQINLTSAHDKVSQNGPDSGRKTVFSSKQSAQTSDVREAGRASQISEFKADSQMDLSSAGHKSKCLQSDNIDQEDVLNEEGLSASLLLSSSSSGELDQTAQGAASLPAPTREPLQNEDQILSGPTPSQNLLSQILIYNAEQKQKAFATTVFECSVCFMGLLGSECVQLSECGHVFCQACLAEFCKVQITEGNVQGVTCPQADCTATPTPAQVRSLVGDELFSRYDRLLLQSSLDRMPDVVYCPRRSCGSAVIWEKSSTAVLCSVCGFAFCVTCRKTYHGAEDCTTKKKLTEKEEERILRNLPSSYEGRRALMDDYASGSKERKRLLEKRYGRGIMLFTEEEVMSEEWLTNNSKNCPHCFSKIEKNGGCNLMTCFRCRHIFCWVCLTRLPRIGSDQGVQGVPCSFCRYY